jgi:hypothetical protein
VQYLSEFIIELAKGVMILLLSKFNIGVGAMKNSVVEMFICGYYCQ